MIRNWLTLDQVTEIGDTLRPVFYRHGDNHPILIEAGYALHREGQVYNAKLSKEWIHLNVYDKLFQQEFLVELNTKKPTYTRCNCVEGFPCAHSLAAFLYIYGSFFPTSRFKTQLNTMRDSIKEQFVIPNVRDLYTNRHSEEPVLSLMAEQTEDVVLPELVPPSIETWVQRVRERILVFQNQANAYGNFDSVHFIRYAASGHLLHVRRDHQQLYDERPVYNIVWLTSLYTKILDDFFDAKWNVHTYRMTIPSLQKVIHFSLDEFRRMRKDRLEQMTDDEKQMLFRALDELFYLPQAHHHFVYHWFLLLFYTLPNGDALWNEFADGYVRKSKIEPFRSIEQLLSAFFAGEDEKAHELLIALDFPIVPFYICLYDLELPEERLAKWVELSKHNSVAYMDRSDIPLYIKQYTLDIFIDYMYQYHATMQKDVAFSLYCREVLPYSFSYYEKYLIQQNAWQELIELYVTGERHVASWDRDLLKKLEKDVPELMIPVYMQAAQILYDEKKRLSYRAANKYLRKIRTLSKKLRLEGLYNNFVWELLHRTKRMRALREEIKGGKLLP